MKRLLPPPQVHAFLTCREIIENAHTNENILVGPFYHVPVASFPLRLSASIYVQISGGHGRYALEFQLRNLDGDVSWRCGPSEFHSPNPLLPHEIVVHEAIMDVPGPGKYDLVMSTNGEELCSRTLFFGPRELFAGDEPTAGPG